MYKQKPLSSCCHANIVAQISTESTGHFTCDKCGKPCDMYWGENKHEATAPEAVRKSAKEECRFEHVKGYWCINCPRKLCKCDCHKFRLFRGEDISCNGTCHLPDSSAAPQEASEWEKEFEKSLHDRIMRGLDKKPPLQEINWSWVYLKRFISKLLPAEYERGKAWMYESLRYGIHEKEKFARKDEREKADNEWREKIDTILLGHDWQNDPDGAYEKIKEVVASSLLPQDEPK